MLHYIRGLITMKIEGAIIVETGGIGYRVFVPDNSALYLADDGEEVMVYTEMIVREDDVSLYGFADRESMVLFQKLRTVNGVGAKAALAVLSSMPLAEVHKAILFEDAATLTKANGIGKKTAQRIVLELKDKLGEMTISMPGLDIGAAVPVAGGEREEAIEGLMGLGYSRSEAAAAVIAIEGDGLTAEEYLKRALKGL